MSLVLRWTREWRQRQLVIATHPFLEGIPHDLFVLIKDAGYMIKIMSTYGSLLVNDGQKDSI